MTPVDENIYCEKHPEREANLRCIRCERPMCTQCSNYTSVGYICNECTRQSDDRFFKGTNADYVVAFGVCLAGSAVINSFAMMFGFFFALIIGAFSGGMIASIARQLTGGRVGRRSPQIAIGGLVVGMFLSPTLFFLLRGGGFVILPERALSLATIACTLAMASIVYGIFLRRI